MTTASTRDTSRSAASRSCSARPTGTDGMVRAPALKTPLRLALLALAFACGAYLQAQGTLAAVFSHWDDIVYLSRQHMVLAAVSGGIAIVIGLPLGVLLTRPAVRPYANMIVQV